ncbi:MAG TPA: hypothetical protein VLM85_26295 [Polyangiaceae bacterium]|nr:hypothetical protein [Polyangiaceae bacterium]
MSTLVFVAPRGRAYCGRAVLMGRDGAVRAGPFRALATAGARVAKKHGNADTSPLLPFGHPPAGTYVIAGSMPPGWAHAHRARKFGRVGALLLRAQSGDARLAAENGRGLVAIHGGPRDKAGLLRPTRGGIRLSNTNMSALLREVNAAQLDGDPVELVELVEVEPRTPSAADAKGAHSLAGRREKTGTGVTPMLLFPFVLLGDASGAKLARRDLLRTALVVAGAMAVQACDRASPCQPYGCDPSGDAGATEGGARLGDGGFAGDGGCPPSGYVCDPYGGVG